MLTTIVVSSLGGLLKQIGLRPATMPLSTRLRTVAGRIWGIRRCLFQYT